jgi:hypothetical protein
VFLQLSCVASLLGLFNNAVHGLFGRVGKVDVNSILCEEQGHTAAHTSAPDHGNLVRLVWLTSHGEFVHTEVNCDMTISCDFGCNYELEREETIKAARRIAMKR